MLLRSLKDMMEYKIEAEDGDIGKVSDFYFDDRNWVIRYLVDKTGVWLFGRHILISPASFGEPDWEKKVFSVNLTKEQVKNSPSIEADKPVSKEHEKNLVNHFHWPLYWGGGGTGTIAGTGYAGFSSAYPLYPVVADRDIIQDEEKKDEGLRSTEEVKGYKISTSDGELGYVEDFIVEDENWTIRYMVIDTKKFLDGRKVLIAPEWIHWISWHQKLVSVDMKNEDIKNCPEFNTSLPVPREYEEMMYDHYGYPKYWDS